MLILNTQPIFNVHFFAQNLTFNTDLEHIFAQV